MKKILPIIICFLVLIAVAPLFAKGKKSTPVATTVVTTRNHTQPIAVNAGVRAWVGLNRAAAHSPVISAVTDVKPPSEVIYPGKK